MAILTGLSRTRCLASSDEGGLHWNRDLTEEVLDHLPRVRASEARLRVGDDPMGQD